MHAGAGRTEKRAFCQPFPLNVLSPFCGVCTREVEDDDKGIQCEGDCMRWFHARCANLTDQEYEQLCELETLWECPSCRDPNLPDFNTVDAVDVFHFDFQQNLPTPKLPVGKQFYLRLLWTYLFGVYSASMKMTTTFMWHELLAKRGL